MSFRDGSIIEGRGVQNGTGGGGDVKFNPYEKGGGGRKKFQLC